MLYLYVALVDTPTTAAGKYQAAAEARLLELLWPPGACKGDLCRIPGADPRRGPSAPFRRLPQLVGSLVDAMRATRAARLLLLLLGARLCWLPRTCLRAAPAPPEAPSLLPELLRLAQEGGDVAGRVEEVFAEVAPEDLAALRLLVSDPEAEEHAAAQRVGDAIQLAMTKRLTEAKGVVEELIRTADGDINLQKLGLSG